MKFSISSRQSFEYLRRADEITVEYNDREIIIDLVEKYPEASINLVLPYQQDAHINWKEIEQFCKMSRSGFILGVINSVQLAEALKLNIPVYHRALIHTFEELRGLSEAGVSEAILGAPLFFQLDKVKQNFPNLKLRAIANVALPEGSASQDSGVCGIWIRPEDVSVYEPYITTLGFVAEHRAEQALFRIYSERKSWGGELRLLVKDLNHPAINNLILPELAEKRISCGQRCKENGICHLCPRILDLANADKLRDYLAKTENN